MKFWNWMNRSLLHWNQPTWEDAYVMGIKRAQRDFDENMRRHIEYLNKSLPLIEKALAEEFKLRLRVVDEKDGSIDFHTGKVCSLLRTYEVQEINLRFQLVPENKYIQVMSRHEILAAYWREA